MPSYDFRCPDCRWRGVLRFKSFADYDTAEKTCPRCQGKNVVRSIRRVAILRSEDSRFDAMEDDSALAGLEDADPQTLGRFMRRMSAESGEDLGDEFNEVVGRLEKGEDPESIESSLEASGAAGDILGGGADDGGLGGGDF
ncbi:MAG TPA: hypothetical protein PLD47_07690 [Aggregatilineales bacterium]|nr:zinc ribbon domain-containing protein [Anaerolineales bacterium]HRE47589.1 hypothetical protein [Aggregatilineales bacterium]